MMLGDVLSGYMVLPASVDVRERLTIAACKLSVPVDGLIPQKPGTPQQAGASRVVGAADDIKTMGKFLRSDSVIVLDFWPDTPDAVAKPGETVAESLPRIAISHLRKHGNDSEMLLFIKNRLEVASLGTGIRLGDFEPVGIAGMRFSYVANKGREKVSIMLRPLANEVISMKDKTTLNEKGAKELADDRMTEPGIFIIGDDVIYDGEAEHFGVPSMTKAPPMSEDDTPLGDQ